MAKSLFEQIVDKSVTFINKEDLEGITQIGNNAFTECTSLTSIIIPDSTKLICNASFSQCTSLTTVTVGNSVSSIERLSFANVGGAMSISNVYFRQPSGMTISLPTAGSIDGMFYVKTARNMNVHTDNETIKNYAWASDNITPTFYHLDGTPW